MALRQYLTQVRKPIPAALGMVSLRSCGSGGMIGA